MTALVLLDADCIMTCPAIVPTAELGVLFEMPKQRGSHALGQWLIWVEPGGSVVVKRMARIGRKPGVQGRPK